ncbi:MAG: hypothetical protein ACXAB9_15555, partial [Candidatus Thorarchaeota archaeon]
GNDGTKDRPYLTVAQAIVNSTLNDCIVVMPGHTETISSTVAGGSSLSFHIDSSHVNLTIWGVGNYDYMPTFTQTAKIELKGANAYLHNLKFVSGSTNLDMACAIQAKGVTLDGCRFEEVAASTFCYQEGILVGGTDSDADGTTIKNCILYMDSGQSSGAIIISGAHHDLTINRNKIAGWFSSGGGPIYSNDTASMKNIEVGWNLIANTQSTATNTYVGIYFDSKTGTGYIHNNYIQSETSGDGGATPVVVVNATCTIGCFENLHSGESLESGLLTPAVYAT